MKDPIVLYSKEADQYIEEVKEADKPLRAFGIIMHQEWEYPLIADHYTRGIAKGVMMERQRKSWIRRILAKLK